MEQSRKRDRPPHDGERVLALVDVFADDRDLAALSGRCSDSHAVYFFVPPPTHAQNAAAGARDSTLTTVDRDALRREADRRLRAFADQAGVKSHEVIETDSAKDALVLLLEQRPFDVIVLGPKKVKVCDTDLHLVAKTHLGPLADFVNHVHLGTDVLNVGKPK